MIEFMRGIRTPLRTTRRPAAVKTASKPSEDGVAVMHYELDAGADLIEVHAQVPALLYDPLAAGMGGGAQDPDPASGVFDRGQHVGLGAVQQVNGEQVEGQDRLGLGAQELRPARAGAPWRAMGSTRRTMRRWVGGRPGLSGLDLAAQRRRTISRCQRRIVPG
jgi:hypothetical protein